MNLDISKTYVGWQIGTALISKLIQKFSKDEAEWYKIKEPATHIFMLFYQDGWQVVESHMKTNGVHKDTLEHWLKDYNINELHIAPCELDMTWINYYLDFHTPYSVSQIISDAVDVITEKNLWNDGAGVVCSELFAKCEKDLKTVYNFKLPTYLIKPVHIQIMYNNMEVKNVF